MDITVMDLAVNLDDLADAATSDAVLANVRRAVHGLGAVAGWAERAASGAALGREPIAVVIGDVLTDLMHAGRFAGIDFDEIVDRAGRRYIEECEEELTST
jgi:hypothetical protein